MTEGTESNQALAHRTLTANGITQHITEQGSGPLVLLCHGWPELSYSWRHQIPVLAQAGYRVVAPDMRGYGGSAVPHAIDDYAITDLVGDMVALVAALGETRACIVGHDWGANVAWSAALLRPDLFTAVAALSVPHRPRSAAAAPLSVLRAAGLADYYWFYFNREGVPEAEFEHNIESALRRVLAGVPVQAAQGGASNPGAPSGGAVDANRSLNVAAGGGFLDGLADPPVLPGWLSEVDIAVYAAAFRKNGFRGPFNWYRNIDRNWALLAPFQGAKITPPALFIAGDRDAVVTTSMGKRALDTLETGVPNLRGKVLISGAGHWIQQERPDEVNAALLRFLAVDYPAN
jgi:pimeloyl-ACP methyl ester carboxylesterase